MFMARNSPVLPLHENGNALFMPYGDPETPQGAGSAVFVVAAYEEPELEYAALRKHCVLMDEVHRGVLEVRGKDRVEFLNRMVTQELKGFGPGMARRSFWLNRKGRIDADLVVVGLEDRVLLITDIHAVERALKGLSSYIVMEEVEVRDITDSTHCLALHGPTTGRLLSAMGAALPDPGGCTQAKLANTDVTLVRDDSAGETGTLIIAPADRALDLYRAFIEAGHDATHRGAAALREGPRPPSADIQLRPAGWHAYNIARIEAGSPLYNIDFGEQSLPAESGVLNDRVSFTKGCYLGQEVVARMHSRGHSKQVLVAVTFESEPDPQTGFPRQPVTGAPVWPAGAEEAVGAIASSTIAPMLGSRAVAFAQVKQSHAAPGTVIEAEAGGGRVKGVVQPTLRFWARAAAGT
jgi:folate-binding protein YgfZ